MFMGLYIWPLLYISIKYGYHRMVFWHEAYLAIKITLHVQFYGSRAIGNYGVTVVFIISDTLIPYD